MPLSLPDGTITYRRWRLDRIPCRQRPSNPTSSRRHSCNGEVYLAFAPHDASREDLLNVTKALGFSGTIGPGRHVFVRHVGGDAALPYPTIESCIDAFEREISSVVN